LQRLLTGDVTDRVRDALGADAPADALDADQYLILSVKYCQNSFKYNSFSFHVVCTDLGTLVQTWRLWAAPRGLRIAPVLWFDEPRLNELLGVPGEQEAVFGVVPLHWAGGPPGRRPATAAAGRPRTDPGHRPAVRHRDAERSRTLLDFDALRAMHTATLAGAADRPAPGALAAAAAPSGPPPAATAPRVPLPGPVLPDTGVRRALRERRSSFGRFDARRRVAPGELSAVLAACAQTRLAGDTDPSGRLRLARVYAFVHHLRDVEQGAYAYDPDRGEPGLVAAGPPGSVLERRPCRATSRPASGPPCWRPARRPAWPVTPTPPAGSASPACTRSSTTCGTWSRGRTPTTRTGANSASSTPGRRGRSSSGTTSSPTTTW